MPTDQNDKQTKAQLARLHFFLASLIGFMSFMTTTFTLNLLVKVFNLFGQEWVLPAGIICGLTVTYNLYAGLVVGKTKVTLQVSQEALRPICDNTQEPPVGVRRTSYSSEILKFMRLLGVILTVLGVVLGIKYTYYSEPGLGSIWDTKIFWLLVIGTALIQISSANKSS